MALSVRSLADESEWDRQYQLIGSAFGAVVEPPTEPMRSAKRSTVDPRLSIVVLDGDEHVGGCAASLFDLSLPGGWTVPATGLSGVGVAPDAQGRGAMRAMVEEHLKRSVSVGAAASLLMASEPSLYWRFGYGQATSVATHRISVDRAELAVPFTDPGRVDVYARGDEQRDAVSAVYERLMSSNPGMTSRNDGWWRVVLSDEDDWKGPAKPFVAVHSDADGEPDGYALYVVASSGGELWRPRGIVNVHEMVTSGVEADKAMWQFLVGLPLVRELRWHLAPVEPLLRLLLAHRRELDTEMVNDMIWLRPLDVVALLEGRTYERDGVATFGVTDDMFPDQVGPWRLTVTDGRGSVERLDDAAGQPGVQLSPEQLGMVVLGGASVRILFQLGLVDGAVDAVGALSDLLVTTTPPRSVSRF